jgi:DNA-binding IclR family transcriptional regulator
MSTTADDKYIVPALQRGLELLGTFNRDAQEQNGADLARKLDLPRASVFRMLHTLERAGFVERVGDTANYRLGLGVLRLGFEYLASMELTEHGRPVIEELRDATGYSAHLVVRDKQQVVFIAKAAGRSALFHSIQVGARLPAHATVLGRMLMADLDKKALTELYPETPLPKFTERTPTTLAQLKAMIDAERAQGYAISQGGFETGISTTASRSANSPSASWSNQRHARLSA